MAQPSESTDAGPLGRGLTVEARNGPIASDAAGNAGQLEDEGPGVGVRVIVGSRDVDAVDVPAHPLADLGLLGYESRGVVINIYQVDLQRAGAGGGRRAWEQRREGRGGGGGGRLGVRVGEKIASRRGRKAATSRPRERRDGRRGREGRQITKEKKKTPRNNFTPPSEGASFTALVLEERCGRVGLAASDNPPTPPTQTHTHTPPPLPPIEKPIAVDPDAVTTRPAGRKQARCQ